MSYWLGMQVQMLGDFQIAFEGHPISLAMKQSAKPVQLLQLLLESHKEGVSRNTLIDALFGQESEDDGARGLNVAVSRLRKLLRESDLPDEKYINVQADRYFFDCPFPIEIDVEEVARLRRAADLEKGPDRTSLLYGLCDLYYGRFLPELDGEDWVEVARAQYQRIFQNSMEELCMTLEKSHSYSEMERLAEFAAMMFPFDEWQVWQLKSLLAQGRVKDARKLYRDVEELYATELDAPPTIGMLSAMQLGAQPWRDACSVEDVTAQLAKAKREVEEQAYLPLPSFLATCNLVSRNEEGMSGMQFVLATLSTAGLQPAKRLEESIESLLDGRGIYTKYSRTQYLLAMLGCSKDSAQDLADSLSDDSGAEACVIEL